MTTKANAFADLLKQAKGQGVAETDKADREQMMQPASSPSSSAVKAKRQGKREDRDYGKIGVYIKADTITEVKTRLVRERRDLSDLVQQLLDEWLKDH